MSYYDAYQPMSQQYFSQQHNSLDNSEKHSQLMSTHPASLGAMNQIHAPSLVFDHYSQFQNHQLDGSVVADLSRPFSQGINDPPSMIRGERLFNDSPLLFANTSYGHAFADNHAGFNNGASPLQLFQLQQIQQSMLNLDRHSQMPGGQIQLASQNFSPQPFQQQFENFGPFTQTQIPSQPPSQDEFVLNGNQMQIDPSVAPSRTVYLGNIPSDLAANELLDYVRLGVLELVKILPQKNCAFISFVDPQLALLFHSDCILKKLSIKGLDVRVGWGKNAPIAPQVAEAIQCDHATRNVYLNKLNGASEKISEDELRDDLSAFGPIDCIKIIPDKGIAFIHFLSIMSAIRCVANLPLQEKYLGKKCFYGKDRCAFITKTQQHNAAQYLGLAPGMEHVVTAADREFISSALVQQLAAAAQIATQAGGANNLGNRTVYLGNLHPDSLVEEICNVVRGGLLHSVRFLKERHVCFVTFVDPIAAAQFFAMCQLHGLTIHNRRIKVGWGKHLGPLLNALSLAVSNGALRNIYIGNITDFTMYDAEKLREDFGKFGDIEQINFLQEKNCAFINFVNISNAIKAIDGIKSFNDYKMLKVNFGKDRCGNLPRQFQSSGGRGPRAEEYEAVSTDISVPLLTPATASLVNGL